MVGKITVNCNSIFNWKVFHLPPPFLNNSTKVQHTMMTSFDSDVIYCFLALNIYLFYTFVPKDRWKLNKILIIAITSTIYFNTYIKFLPWSKVHLTYCLIISLFIHSKLEKFFVAPGIESGNTKSIVTVSYFLIFSRNSPTTNSCIKGYVIAFVKTWQKKVIFFDSGND